LKWCGAKSARLTEITIMRCPFHLIFEGEVSKILIIGRRSMGPGGLSVRRFLVEVPSEHKGA
jgi:hypothetical protein